MNMSMVATVKRILAIYSHVIPSFVTRKRVLDLLAHHSVG